MTQDQKRAHEKLLKTLPVHTHIFVEPPRRSNAERGEPKRRKNGSYTKRKLGGLKIPVLGEMTAKRRAFNPKIK